MHGAPPIRPHHQERQDNSSSSSRTNCAYKWCQQH
jgi:hypothetical protein